jgi:hypothetical protein
MSFLKQAGPAPALKPAGEFCDDCRKIHSGGLEICPKLKTNQDLSAFLDEIKTSTETRDSVQASQMQSSGSVPDLLQEKTEKKITLKHLPCDRFVV